MRNTPDLIFDFPDADGRATRLRFARPAAVLRADSLDEVVPVLDRADRLAREGGWAAGFVSYQAAPAFDRALAVPSGARMPLAWFGIFEEPLPSPPDAGGARNDRDVPALDWRPSQDEAAFASRVAQIRDAIADGAVYQVNHTLRLRASFDGAALALYDRLRRAQGEGYFAYVDTGDHRILSVSPELFFERARDRVTSRPMKGTAPRGRWLEEDRAAAASLAASEKDRAENLMIVDMVRNDLGRIAEPGSVRASDLFRVTRYPTVHQMTSTVSARVAPELPLARIFAALFPAASITGAPKIAATRFIAELEDSPREVYCGAVGLIRPGGDCTFNVAIRTVWLDGAGQAEYGVGGGVTWDSTPTGEHAEALAKAAILAAPQPEALLETLRLDDGRYLRLERHLRRMRDSAEYFGLPIDVEEVRRALDEHARTRAAGAWRVRVTAAAGDVVRPTSSEIPAPAAGELPPVAVADRPVSRHDPLLFHKTTSRDVYDAAAAAHPNAFDVLLWNEEGELTEFTRGNLVVRLGGGLWTPPRECGLLAGTFREELLEEGRVRERVVRVEELDACEDVWLINSVREWVPVRLARAAADGGPRERVRGSTRGIPHSAA